eukprot:6491164-Amphidinium_carterae.1
MPTAETPEDLPEEGEQDVEGAQLRPEKRARGRPRKRYLLDISHPFYFAGCSACAGLSYQHSKGCLRFRQNVNADPEYAARVGLTPEQVQMSRDRGLLPDPVAETPGAAIVELPGLRLKQLVELQEVNNPQLVAASEWSWWEWNG